jgi:hypothetical protein
MSGHPGVTKIEHLMAWQFNWPGIKGKNEQYVHRCIKCQRNKASTPQIAENLQPLSKQRRKWRHPFVCGSAQKDGTPGAYVRED